MSATHNESTNMRMLARITDEIGRRASREYIRERVTGVRREIARETDAEIRAAIAESFTTARRNQKGAQ